MDIVFVPDFSGTRSETFKFQLFFALSSLHEFGKVLKDDKVCVHIVSVGKPPEWVARFSELFNLKVYEKNAHRRGGFHNKTLAFDIVPEHSHGLILDTDIFCLSPLMTDNFDPRFYTVSAAPANEHHLSMDQWGSYYKYVGLPLPKNGHGTLDESMQRTGSALLGSGENAIPYYNAGIFCVAWSAEFGEIWSRHLEWYDEFLRSSTTGEVQAEEAERPRMRYKVSNQPAFASAVEEVKVRGARFGFLEESWHLRWRHVVHTDRKLREMVLLHAIGAFKWKDTGKQIRDFDAGIEDFLKFASWQTSAIRRKDAAALDGLGRRLAFRINARRREAAFHAALSRSVRLLASKYRDLLS